MHEIYPSHIVFIEKVDRGRTNMTFNILTTCVRIIHTLKRPYNTDRIITFYIRLSGFSMFHACPYRMVCPQVFRFLFHSQTYIVHRALDRNGHRQHLTFRIGVQSVVKDVSLSVMHELQKTLQR